MKDAFTWMNTVIEYRSSGDPMHICREGEKKSHDKVKQHQKNHDL